MWVAYHPISAGIQTIFEETFKINQKKSQMKCLTKWTYINNWTICFTLRRDPPNRLLQHSQPTNDSVTGPFSSTCVSYQKLGLPRLISIYPKYSPCVLSRGSKYLIPNFLSWLKYSLELIPLGYLSWNGVDFWTLATVL